MPHNPTPARSAGRRSLMQELKLLSALLCYPEPELLELYTDVLVETY